eukprot:1154468-Rhodomonas_salina.1
MAFLLRYRSAVCPTLRSRTNSGCPTQLSFCTESQILHYQACVWSALAHVENSWYRAEFSEDWLEGIREKGNVRSHS